MTNLEHLLENAICACERGETLEDYRNAPANRMMLEDEGVDAELIWAMAYYVVTTYNEQPCAVEVVEIVIQHGKVTEVSSCERRVVKVIPFEEEE